MSLIDIEIHNYDVIKETPSSWVIKSKTKKRDYRVISKSTRKKFAYTTKEKALEGFSERTSAYIGILQHKINEARLFYDMSLEKNKAMVSRAAKSNRD